jgi:secretion/DNA translocation related CpaE-like protein
VPPPTSSRPTARPLVVCPDGTLLDDVLRVLAAAGAEPEIATGGPALRRAHRSAPLVVVGSGALAAPAVHDLPRRPGLVVVSEDELPGADWAAAVALGAERVAVLPQDEAWLLARAARAVREPVARGRLTVVGGSCGGAGASTLATALALAVAARSGRALLVDGDPHGGGLDLLLGAEDVEGLRWPELAGLRGSLAGEALLAALPERDGVHLVTGSRETACAVPGEAVEAVVGAARGAGCSVVVDLPRAAPAAGDLREDADLALLVVPARLRAVCAARLLVGTHAPGPWERAEIVVRSVPGGLTPREVAAVLGRDPLVELPHDRSAVGRSERGEPPPVSGRSPWALAVRRLLPAVDGEAVR